MREIKFRAWFQLYEDSSWVMSEPFDIFNINFDTYDDSKIIFMQFTGLKDKNGKEIYEGDWIKAQFSTGTIYEGEVIFRNGAFNLKEDKPLPRGLSYCNFSFLENFEVIGNIYENPELLKSAKISS